jgi:hypothetical protein
MEGSIREENGVHTLRHALPVFPRPVHSLLMPPMGRKDRRHSCAERDLWHQRLGHPGRIALERIHSEDMVTVGPLKQCEHSKHRTITIKLLLQGDTKYYIPTTIVHVIELIVKLRAV